MDGEALAQGTRQIASTPSTWVGATGTMKPIPYSYSDVDAEAEVGARIEERLKPYAGREMEEEEAQAILDQALQEEEERIRNRAGTMNLGFVVNYL